MKLDDFQLAIQSSRRPTRVLRTGHCRELDLRKIFIPSAVVACLAAGAFAEDTPQPLPLGEFWTLDQVGAEDDWSFVPGIQGYRGDGLAGAPGADPQTLLAEDEPGVLDVNPDQTDPAGDTGGVNEFRLANPVVAVQGSETASAPYLKLHVDTTGQTGVTVRYRLRDLDPSADDAVQAVALQYRVGGSGVFTNVPAAFVADATTAGAATLVTPVCVALPAEVEGAPLVELRIMTADAVGDDENVGIDDILVSTQPCGPPPPVMTVSDVARAEGNAGTTTFSFVVGLLGTAGPGGVTFDVATANGTATTAGGDYVALVLPGQVIPPGASSATFDVTVNGDTVAEPTETFFLNVSNVVGALLFDGQGQGSIVNDDLALTAIHDIQGRGSRSPITGATVTVSAVVTGVAADGFFVQAPEAEYDADPATSEGIFVNTILPPPATAVVGNRVRVDATVAELVPAPQDPLAPPRTVLTSPFSVTLLSTANPLPAPAVLTAAMNLPTGTIEQLERFEGMRVAVPSLTVVGPTAGTVDEPNATASSTGVFVGVITGEGRPFREAGIRANDPPPPATGVTIPPVPRFDGNPERIRVDGAGLVGSVPIDVARGAVVTGLVGPLDYASRTYTVLTDPPTVSPAPVATGGVSAVAVADPTDLEFTVASFNLQRLYDTVNEPDVDDPVLTEAAFANRLRKASLAIRSFAKTPDIVGVAEAENLTTLQALAARIGADAVAASQPDPRYQAFLTGGFEPGGTNVGFLVKQQAVVGTLPRVTVGSVVEAAAAELFTNPDGSTEPLHDRPPLRLLATVNHPNGASFDLTVLAVDLLPLDGIDSRVPGSKGWPTVGWRTRAKRRAQAESLASLVQARQEADPIERIVLVGGFDAFPFNDGYADALGTVQGTPTPAAQVVLASPDLLDPDLTNVQPASQAERYSAVSVGDAQALDHVLVNQALVQAVDALRTEHARIGADFPETARNDAASVLRVSDRDPIVAFFRVPTFPVELSGFSVE